MISPASATRPIGHTTITKQPTGGIRIQGPANGPRLINTQIRGPMSHQTTTTQLQTQSSHAVSILKQQHILVFFITGSISELSFLRILFKYGLQQQHKLIVPPQFKYERQKVRVQRLPLLVLVQV